MTLYSICGLVVGISNLYRRAKTLGVNMEWSVDACQRSIFNIL